MSKQQPLAVLGLIMICILVILMTVTVHEPRRDKINAYQLAAYNQIPAPYILHPGKRLLLPSGNVMTVENGDTIFSMANRVN